MNGSTYPHCRWATAADADHQHDFYTLIESAAIAAVANVALLTLPGHLEELDHHEELVRPCRQIDPSTLAVILLAAPLATDVISAGLPPA